MKKLLPIALFAFLVVCFSNITLTPYFTENVSTVSEGDKTSYVKQIKGANYIATVTGITDGNDDFNGFAETLDGKTISFTGTSNGVFVQVATPDLGNRTLTLSSYEETIDYISKL